MLHFRKTSVAAVSRTTLCLPGVVATAQAVTSTRMLETIRARKRSVMAVNDEPLKPVPRQATIMMDLV
jgi:hypothetical protein